MKRHNTASLRGRTKAPSTDHVLDDPFHILLNEKQAATYLGLTDRALQQRRYASLPPEYIWCNGRREQHRSEREGRGKGGGHGRGKRLRQSGTHGEIAVGGAAGRQNLRGKSPQYPYPLGNAESA